MQRARIIAVWGALAAAASCTLGINPSCRCVPMGNPDEIPEETDMEEKLPHRRIGPCTYQYEPQKRSQPGQVVLEINQAVYPYFEVDEKKRILRIEQCPDGGPPEAREADVGIMFYYDEDVPSAQPGYYAPTSDEIDRTLYRRKLPPPRR